MSESISSTSDSKIGDGKQPNSDPQLSTSISQSPVSHSPISHRDQVGRLSQKAFIAMLVAMFIIPVTTVLTLWYYLPPVSMHKLDATVTFSGMETAEQYDRRDKDAKIPEPLISIKNDGDQQWTHLIVEINKRYKVYRTEEVVDPGQTIDFALDYFMTREGLFFPPGKIKVNHIRVYARLPSRARATYETDID